MGATYKGRSQAIHVGGSGAANQFLGAHGFRLTVPGDQVVANGATATVSFSTDAIADTDDYWDAAAPDQVTIPAGLGGVYLFGADGFVPTYSAGLTFEVVVDSGDGEAPDRYPAAVAPLIHTLPPRSENAMAGFYRVCPGAVVRVEVTNGTGGSRTISNGSFTAVLQIPGSCAELPSVLQHAVVRGDQTSYPVLPNPVGAGDLLVYAVGRADAAVDAAMSSPGWTLAGSIYNVAYGCDGGPPKDYGRVWWKIADGSEVNSDFRDASTGFQPFARFVAEFVSPTGWQDDPLDVVAAIGPGGPGYCGINISGTITPTAGIENALLFAFIMDTNQNTPADSGLTNFDPAWTPLDQRSAQGTPGPEGAGHPYCGNAYRAVNTSGSYTITADVVGGYGAAWGACGWSLVMASFKPKPAGG